MSNAFDNGMSQLWYGDSRNLSMLEDGTVDMCVTSPPYFGLRSYRDTDKEIDPGAQPSVDAYVSMLVDVFREVRRVLKPCGTLWLNLGDSMAGSGGPQWGYKQGDMMGIPGIVAHALRRDGWYLRSEIIWAKTSVDDDDLDLSGSSMPEPVSGWRWEQCKVKVGHTGKAKQYTSQGSVDAGLAGGDSIAEYAPCPGCAKCEANDGLVLRKGSWRPTRAHESIFLLSKSADYFCDQEAVREAATEGTLMRLAQDVDSQTGSVGNGVAKVNGTMKAVGGATRNPRDVRSFSRGGDWHGGGHYATFPLSLPTWCIQAGTPEKGVCSQCGLPMVPVVEREAMKIRRSDWGNGAGNRTAPSGTMEQPATSTVVAHRPACSCGAPMRPALVLDPFGGLATTAVAAQRLGRRAICVDASESYLKLAAKRLSKETMPMVLAK